MLIADADVSGKSRETLLELIMRFSPAAVAMSLLLATVSSVSYSQTADVDIKQRSVEYMQMGEAAQTKGNLDLATDLYETALGILQIQERPITRLFVRRDPYGRFFSCLLYVPRETYTTKLRIQITEILKETFGAISEPQFTTNFSESILARIHFIVPVENAEKIKYDVKEIEKNSKNLKGKNICLDIGIYDEFCLYFGARQIKSVLQKSMKRQLFHVWRRTLKIL